LKKGEKRREDIVVERREDIVVERKEENRRYSCFKERKKEGYWMVAVTRAGTKGSHL